MESKGLRFDLAIAVCALLISAVAAAASVYQSHVISQQNALISQQFGATTWPYLSFINSYSADYVQVDLRNNGLGPAIIRTADVTLDGKFVGPGKTNSSIDSVIETAVREAEEDAKSAKARGTVRHAKLHTSTMSLTSGDVLPAGTDWVLVRADGPFITRRVFALRTRFNIKLCYCSLVGRCWTKEFAAAGSPRDVPGCSSEKKAS
ncbi:MAG: hypothetical protein JOZ97_06025 [Candidatus Eremiobacteraeota bacterium]|nr:hypothetical protein [Candidatus Eremiobacteraeota bacterium]